ncbi:MAG: OsmC family protein [Pseudomonadota bacterium]
MTHEAWVDWTLDAGADMPAGRYSRVHRIRFDGGAEVAGAPSPSIVPPPWSDPAAVDPEEAFVASVSACHMLWFLDLARCGGLTVAAYRDHAVGEMAKNEAGELWVARIALRPEIGWPEGAAPAPGEVAALHDRAHAKCFIANSVKTEITIAPA